MQRTRYSVLILSIWITLTLANPIPQSLTEEQFRSFGDDEPEVDDNQVEIVSGYSSVSHLITLSMGQIFKKGKSKIGVLGRGKIKFTNVFSLAGGSPSLPPGNNNELFV